MDPHEQQQFDFFLLTACDRFIERITQRCAGPENALRQLRDFPEGEGIWLSEFVSNLFTDFLLDNPDGACWVLRALANQKVNHLPPQGATISHTLVGFARHVFASLLRRRCLESLDRNTLY